MAIALLYNRLVSTRQRVREAWSAIDVQLQRRASLIPNLVEAVKGYAAFERDTMRRITEARGALASAAGPARPPRPTPNSPARCARSWPWPRPTPS